MESWRAAAVLALALLLVAGAAAVGSVHEDAGTAMEGETPHRKLLQSASKCFTATDCHNTISYYCNNFLDPSVAGKCTHKGGNYAPCYDDDECENAECDIDSSSAPLGKCYAYGGGNCFPGDAVVTVALDDGARVAKKKLSELTIGDRVQVVDTFGKPAFDDVWFFAHREAEAESVFVHLELAGGATLRLTGDHFVPVGPLWAARVMKRAREVLPGDVVHTLLKGGAVATRQVDAVALDMGAGLYNPLTATGTIVVDGVVASVQSGFVFDGAMDALGLTAFIPALYQALFAPGYWLYRVIGAENTIALEAALDLTNLLHKNQWLWTTILASSTAVALGATAAVGKKVSGAARRRA